MLKENNLFSAQYTIPLHPTSYDPSLNAVGMDLGTTRCCVAVNRRDKIDVIALDEFTGSRVLPSFISFDEEKTKCGQIVVKRMQHHAKNTIYDIKRIIGKSFESITIDSFWPFKVIKHGEVVKIQTKDFNDQEKLISPEELSSIFLKHMKEIVEEYQNQKIFEAVLTVPAAFSQNQIDATLEAAAFAGWKTIHILPEPIAACFAYAEANQIPNDSNVLLFDLGGGTLDVCIIRAENGTLKILGSFGDLYLGGRDFDALLVNYFSSVLLDKYGVDLSGDNVKKYRLLIECQEAKHELSVGSSAKLDVDTYVCNANEGIIISQTKFKELSNELLIKIDAKIRNALGNLILHPNEINRVFLAGGGSKMPMIKELLKNIFSNAQHCCNIDPDWAVAYGASLYCCHLKSSENGNASNIILQANTNIVFDDVADKGIIESIETRVAVPIEIPPIQPLLDGAPPPAAEEIAPNQDSSSDDEKRIPIGKKLERETKRIYKRIAKNF